MSINLWGWSETWMQEGSAIAYDGACVSDQMAAHLHKNGELIPFNNIITDFFNQEPTIAYLQSGMMFRYLYKHYGIKETKKIWQEGTDAMESIIGISAVEFENIFFLVVDQNNA